MQKFLPFLVGKMDSSLLELDLDLGSGLAASLERESGDVILRFPSLFDGRLKKGLEKLIANSPSGFLAERTYFHLKRILLSQFSQQMKMEESLAEENQKPLFLKLFRSPPSQICIAFAGTTAKGIQKEQVLKAFQGLLPSIQETPRSFFSWRHPELPYSFTYFEVQKLRGKDPSTSELRELERKLVSQLLAISPLTPALFWPYNKEDSFRQIQLLQREMKSPNDLPHVSVHFQEQTPTSLEFLIHLVRPAGSTPLDTALKQLPNTFSFFSQYYKSNKIPFPIEIAAFSVKIPSFSFEIRESINLLYARRYVLKHLEGIVGPYRDTNGGLFEIQQQHFETIRSHLSDKIPHFELFAEKVFYALHPVETWLTLSLSDAESFFSAFSSLLSDPAPFGARVQKESFTIVKSTSEKMNRNIVEFKEKTSHAQVSFGDSHYICLIGPGSNLSEIQFKENCNASTLRLLFQEGPPPSLNPHYSSGDMRCRILTKLLFEGLTRIGPNGMAELAGAESCNRSEDGLTYTFQLRSSYWSNGEKVSASDYVSSLQSALSDSINHPEYLYILKGASTFKEKKKGLGVRALDPLTLQIELEKSDPKFLEKLAQPYFFPLFGAMREPKWFNGPYLVREMGKEGILLDKNAYFWDSGRLGCDQIEFHWLGGDEGIFNLFENGEIDWIGDPLTILCPEQIGKLQAERKLHAKTVGRRFSLYFNTLNPILSSPLIRQALSMAIDRTFICSQIYPGSIAASPGFAQPKTAVAIFEKGLREQGLDREAFSHLIFYYSLQTRREKLAKYLQNVWKETLGISIQTKAEPWNAFRCRLEERTYDLCGTIQDTLAEGSLEYYERFEGDNSWNFSEWTNREYRELLKDANDNPKTLDALDKILEEEVPFSPLFNYTHLFAHHSRLDGFWIDAEGCVDFSRAFFRKYLNGEKNVERKTL